MFVITRPTSSIVASGRENASPGSFCVKASQKSHCLVKTDRLRQQK
jgi:hypothetical protein